MRIEFWRLLRSVCVCLVRDGDSGFKTPDPHAFS
jgi:hypothetical protein